MSTQTVLEQILKQAQLVNEAGLPLDDFTTAGLDSLDFANVSRFQLKMLLLTAFEAGKAAA